MRLNRLFAYFIGCASLVLIFLIFLIYIHGLGFPDGFISELGYAERKLAYVFILAGFTFGSYFFYLGWVAPRKPIGNKLAAAFILYLIFVIGISIIDNYYQSHLAGSGGG